MRSRNIKPGFFKNEDLAELGAYAQLLFIGLWQIADKGGKLEDRPKRIKIEIFPYYEIKPSIETLLNHLVEKRFLIRYKVGGVKLLKITNFEKHQSPHHTEKSSIFPDHSPETLITSDSPSCNRESTVSSPLLDGEYPPDSLNPDSLINTPLTPLTPQGGNGKRNIKNQISYSEGFIKFWESYPNRSGGMEEAWKSWQKKIKVGKLPPVNYLLDAVIRLSQSPKWQENEGQFIPMITTFLNQGRWTDAGSLKVTVASLSQKRHTASCPQCKGSGTYLSGHNPDGSDIYSPCNYSEENHGKKTTG